MGPGQCEAPPSCGHAQVRPLVLEPRCVSLGKVTNVRVVGVSYFLDKQGSGRKRLIYGSDGRIFCSAEVLHEEMCGKSRDAEPARPW